MRSRKRFSGNELHGEKIKKRDAENEQKERRRRCATEAFHFLLFLLC